MSASAVDRLEGDLDLHAIPALLPRLDGLASGPTVDLSGVRRVDSAGLSLLLELMRRAKNHGVALRFTGAPASLRALATFFGVDSLLRLEERP